MFRRFRRPPLHSFSLLLVFASLFVYSPSLVASKPEQADCVEVVCPLPKDGGTMLGLLERDGHRPDMAVADCERCEQCTQNGYSVCVQPLRLSLFGAEPSPNKLGCECAHSGPAVQLEEASNNNEHEQYQQQQRSVMCRLPVTNGRPKGTPRPNAGEGVFRVCFSSAIRKMPKPEARNNLEQEKPGQPDVLVTVEQFWLSDYWRALKPTGLHLYYVFPVAMEDGCEGKMIVPSANDLMWINAGKSKEEVARLRSIWLCKASLQIAIGTEEDGAEGGDQHHPEPEGGSMADYPLGDDDMPPEVVFERNVFAGAEKVRLYYEVTVQRENQLKSMPGGKVRFEWRKTKVQSDPLDFDLHPERYTTAINNNNRNQSISKLGQRVDVEQHKATQPAEPIVRPPGASRNHKSVSTRTKNKPMDASTAVPVPSSPTSSSSSSISTQQASTSSTTTSTRADRVEATHQTKHGEMSMSGPDERQAEEDWKLLRNVLLIVLLCIAVLVVLAFCYKQGLACFGRNAQHSEMRNGKTRNMNGKEYREARQQKQQR